jgi:hypothetical protein
MMSGEPIPGHGWAAIPVVAFLPAVTPPCCPHDQGKGMQLRRGVAIWKVLLTLMLACP